MIPPLTPISPNSPTFGILKSWKPTQYGQYMVGEYKGYKIEVFDAYKNKQKLIYVSKMMNWVKSKLIYFENNIKKIVTGERYVEQDT